MGRINLRQGTSRAILSRHRLAVLLLLAGSAGLLILPLSFSAPGGSQPLQPSSSSLLADDLLAIPTIPMRIRVSQTSTSSLVAVTTTATTRTAHVAQASQIAVLQEGFCAGLPVSWPAYIRQWSIPSGCYSHIYYPNRYRYVSRPSFGWCNWWPEVLHYWLSGYTALHLPSHSWPAVGATVYFAPYVQGASSAGHYAEVVAIGPHGWLLITEMNFYWRGGGFARVDYRFIHTGSGVSFRY